MKPVNRIFGFFLLVFTGLFLNHIGEYTGASIFMVGAVLFDAIKTIGKDS